MIAGIPFKTESLGSNGGFICVRYCQEGATAIASCLATDGPFIAASSTIRHKNETLSKIGTW